MASIYYVVGFRHEDGSFMPWRVCITLQAADALVRLQKECARDALYLLRATVESMPVEGDD